MKPEQADSGLASGAAYKTFFYTLDGIRGVAALLIVLRHTETLFNPWRLQESYLAVDVFFVLSGVVISQAYGARLQSGLGFWRFAWVRAVRILPLYLLGTAISLVAVALGFVAFGPMRYVALYTVLGMFMIPNPGIGTANVYPLNNPSWSLPLELLVNLFYAGFVRVLSKTAIAAVMILSSAGLAFTLYKAQSHSLNIGFWARSFPFGVFRVGYSFFAGVLIFDFHAKHHRQSSGRWPTVACWAVISAVCLLFACSPDARLQPYYDFTAVTLGFPALVYLALLVQPAGASAVACRFLGAISYAVYTLHAPVGGLIEGLYEALIHTSLDTYAPSAGVGLFLILVPVCLLADRVYDYPVRRYLLGLKLRNTGCGGQPTA